MALPRLIWNREMVETAAFLCESRSELCRKFPAAYQSARKRGWLESLGLPPYKPSKDAIDFNAVIASASHYQTMADWKIYDYAAYSIAKKNSSLLYFRAYFNSYEDGGDLCHY